MEKRGNDSANAIVNLADVAGVRANQTGFGSTDISDPYDFDRNEKVNLIDLSIARGNQSGFTPLKLITPSSSGSRGSSWSGSGSGDGKSGLGFDFGFATGSDIGTGVDGDTGGESGFKSGNQSQDSDRGSEESGQAMPLQLAGSQDSAVADGTVVSGADSGTSDRSKKSDLLQQRDSLELGQRDELFGGFGI